MKVPQDWDWLKLPDETEEIFVEYPNRWYWIQKNIERIKNNGTMQQMAAENSVNVRSIQKMLLLSKKQLLKHGIDLSQEGNSSYVAPPHYLKGQSTYYRIDPQTGHKIAYAQWHKTDFDREQKELGFREYVESAVKGIKPFPLVKQPKTAPLDKDKCTVYTLTDFHLGMYAWADETGDDWDMDIAEKVMLGAFQDMMDGSPDSEQAVFAQLGDLLHWDGMLSVTPNAKNVLDADTRFPRVVQSAINMMMKAVEMLLHKHKNVHVIMAEGNHDQASSVWLRAIMGAMFAKNKRVTVELSPFPYYVYRFEDIFLAWHHGHLTRKLEDLPLRFATEWRDDFGKCKWTYIHTGHNHTRLVIEKAGVYVEQHPTLAARDAYAARNFLMAQRGASAITYAKGLGEYSRITVRPKIDVKGV